MSNLSSCTAVAGEAVPMPHRLFLVPLAPIFGVVGFVTTGIFTVIGSTVQQTHALYATAAEAPVSTGWYGGLLMALVGAIVSVYQGWRQTKRAQDTEDRAVWRAELMQADQDRAELKAEVKRLNDALCEMGRKIEHANNNVKQSQVYASQALHEIDDKVSQVAAVTKSTNRKATRALKALTESGHDLTATDPDMATMTPEPGTKLPPEVVE